MLVHVTKIERPMKSMGIFTLIFIPISLLSQINKIIIFFKIKNKIINNSNILAL